MKPLTPIFLILAGTVMFAQAQERREIAVLRLQVVVIPVVQSVDPAQLFPREVMIAVQPQRWEVRQVKSELPAKNHARTAVLETTIVLPR
jgi:hypothetical protein